MQKVSVVTVSLNAIQHIRNAIESVLAQTYPNVELIVIDGGSTDGTIEIINQYAGAIAYLVSEPDGGVFNAMNKGIKASTGSVLFFLNADDRFSDDRVIEDVISVFHQHPDVEIVYGNLLQTLNGRTVHRKPPSIITRKVLARRTILHQAVFSQKRVFESTGGFSELYRIVGDYEWMLRVFLQDQRRYFYYDRDITLMGTQGLSWTTSWEDERITVMNHYFGPYEIWIYRRLPQFLQKITTSLGRALRGWLV